MKLLGRDIDTSRLLQRLEDRLKARGLEDPPVPPAVTDVESRVDPLSFSLRALDENADPTVGLPLETHRGGVGRGILLAKWAFRKTCQVFINEALGRQRVFNAISRDAYAQVSADVLRLKREVALLEAKLEEKEKKAKGRRAANAAKTASGRLDPTDP